MNANVPAFPQPIAMDAGGNTLVAYNMADASGMTTRQYFAAQALANPAICTGSVPEYTLQQWFGERTGITQCEIVARQAFEFADAMIKEGHA